MTKAAFVTEAGGSVWRASCDKSDDVSIAGFVERVEKYAASVEDVSKVRILCDAGALGLLEAAKDHLHGIPVVKR